MKWIVLLAFLLIADISAACSCGWPRGSESELIKWKFDNADVVLLAKVHSFREIRYEESEELIPPPSKDWGYQVTEFERITAWKGSISDKFTTRINSNCCLCGYKFIVGKEYLLYLSGPDKKGYFHTGFCSGTKLASEAKKDIEIIEDD